MVKVFNDFNNTELLLSIGCLKRSPNEINPFQCVSRSCDHLVIDFGLRLVRWFATMLRFDTDIVTAEVGTTSSLFDRQVLDLVFIIFSIPGLLLHRFIFKAVPLTSR